MVGGRGTMFTGYDPTLHAIALGLLGAAAIVYAVGAAFVLTGLGVVLERARPLARLAGLLTVAPPLVGLACLVLVMEGLGLGYGHGSDVMSRWPDLLSTVAVLTAGAGFLSGLLAGARSLRTAVAVGAPMTLLALFIWAMVAGLGLVVWREESEAARGVWAERAVVRPFLTYLTLFPVVGLLASAVATTAGRSLRTLLGLAPGTPDVTGAMSTAGPHRVASAPAEPRPAATDRAGLSDRVVTERTMADRVTVRPAGARHVPSRPLAPKRAMRALPLDRWPAHALTRGLLIFLGTSGLLTGTCDALRPRARLVASDPVAGTTLATPPALVTLTFTEALDPSSNVNVARTVTVLPTGEELATGGTPVADATGAAALSADGRSLRVRLPPNPPGGLYAVQWAAVRAGNRTERFGHLYFGVGMPVPDHIVRDGVLQERDADPYDRKSAIGGGILLIGLGLALPLLVKRSWTTGTAPW